MWERETKGTTQKTLLNTTTEANESDRRPAGIDI
jgi:hypothetical protein